MSLRALTLPLVALAIGCGDDSPATDTSGDTTDTTIADTSPDTGDSTQPDTPDTADTAAPDTEGDTASDTAQDTNVPVDTADGVTPTDTADTTPDDTNTPLDTADTGPADTTPADTDTATNAAPTITAGPSANDDAPVAGDPVELTVTATDDDGDSLTYTWRQVSPASPTGTFSGANGGTITFSTPALSAATAFTLEVSVADGTNTPVTARLTLDGRVPKFAADIAPIFSVCTGCHGGSGGLTLSPASAYSNLVNVAANACSPMVRVKPGAPDDSVIIKKISGADCGSRMPRNNPDYFVDNPELITRIRSWILAGALND